MCGVHASPKSAEFKDFSGFFIALSRKVRSSCFQGLSLPDDALFSVRSPIPEGAILPVGKKSPLLHPGFWAIEISCHPEAFCCQDKSILIIPQDFYGISFSVTEDENIVSIIRIQLEAESNSSNQSGDLFPEIRGSTGKEDPGCTFCNTLHHNFFNV